MNERAHFFLKICISHSLTSMFLWCVRDEWRQGQTAILTQFLLTITASWLRLLDQGSLRTTALSLQAGPHSGLPVSNKLNCCRDLSIFFHNAHFFPLLFPLIYTGAFLIDGSVKGQYTTVAPSPTPRCNSC